MKLLVLTIGDPEAGSTKYRIVQYENFLKENDIEIQYIQRQEIDSATIDLVKGADVVLNQKCLFKTSLARRIIANSKRIIVDFDDAIWTRPGKPHSFLTERRVDKRFHLWLKNADAVLVANEYLAKYARKYSTKVLIIPMALDLQKWAPGEKADDGVIRIGWAGSPGNLRYLKTLESALRELTSRYDNLEVMIYCGETPELECSCEHTPFEPGTETEFIQQLDIGLLPLRDEKYLRGKSPIKAVQYLSCGIPVVASIYGATAEMLRPTNSLSVESGNWLEAIDSLINNKQQRAEMGKAGVAFVQKYHNILYCRQRLLDVIKGLLP